jgi:hypothetical protein
MHHHGVLFLILNYLLQMNPSMSEVTSKEVVPPSFQEHTKGGWLVVLKDLLCINMSDIAIVKK